MSANTSIGCSKRAPISPESAHSTIALTRWPVASSTQSAPPGEALCGVRSVAPSEEIFRIEQSLRLAPSWITAASKGPESAARGMSSVHGSCASMTNVVTDGASAI